METIGLGEAAVDSEYNNLLPRRIVFDGKRKQNNEQYQNKPRGRQMVYGDGKITDRSKSESRPQSI